MPEKNGCTVIVGEVCVALPVVVLVVDDVGDEELVGADLEHRLLVVERRDARAGQHLHLALRLEESEQRGEVRGLQREPEHAAAGDCLWRGQRRRVAAERAATRCRRADRVAQTLVPPRRLERGRRRAAAARAWRSLADADVRPECGTAPS